MWLANLLRGGFTEPRHIRRMRGYLEEARMAMLEQSIAAEHYHASAEMYAERVRRLQQELEHWEELRQTGRQTAKDLPERSTKLAGPSRLEPASVPPSPPVGIVRAA